MTVATAGRAAAAPARTAVWWREWRAAILTGGACFLVARVITEVVGLIAAYGSHFLSVPAHDPHAALAIWQQWDAGWYLHVATYGYDDSHIAAFPPLPGVLIGALSRITHVDPLLVGLVIAFIAGAAACAALFRLVELDHGRRTAGLAVFLLLTFPTALFLQSVYAEGLLLFFAVSAFLAMRRGHLLLSGGLVAGAVLCKTYALLLVVPLLVDRWSQARPGTRDVLLTCAAIITPPVLALAGWMAYLQHRFGDAFLVVSAERFWGRALAPPWVAIAAGVRNIGTAHLVEGMDLVALVLIVIAAVYCWLRVRRSYAVLLALSALVFASSSTLTSTGRFAVDAFPLFIAAAVLASQRRWFERAWVAVFVPLSVYYLVAFTTGRWAG